MTLTIRHAAGTWPVVLLGGAMLVAISMAACSGGSDETGATAPAGMATGTADHADHEGMAMDQSVAPATPTGSMVTLTPELVRRAGIVAGAAGTTAAGVSLRLPGEVTADAYRSVAVTPLVAGRVVSVSAELGDRIRAGEALARLYSPALAAAETAFLSRRAELEAHHEQLERTGRLLDIGAASQQELDHVREEHTAMTARVEAARAELELLGLSPDGIDRLDDPSAVSALADVPAPIDGIVLERRANVGLNVDPSMSLFTVVDLSVVWVIADLYERDFALVREGASATVTTSAYPEFRFDGRVGYIDPMVQRETRTARLRVEVPNRDGRLRLGMYVDVSVAAASDAEVVVVPVDAVQAIGARSVVYVPGEVSGTFMERDVQPGRRWDDLVEVVSGLEAGEAVVVEGAFFLRAERERVAPGLDVSAGTRDDR
jgi:cobalt-zinc-cadmium efflux system membrane fusion protein